MKRSLSLILALFLILPLIPVGAEENALYPVRVDGLWGYMDRAGKIVIEPQWDQAGPFDGTAAVVGKGASNPDRLYGMVLRDGSLAVPVAYPGIWDCGPFILFSDQFFMDYGLTGWYHKDSGFFQEPVFNFVDRRPSSNGLVYAGWVDRGKGVFENFYNDVYTRSADYHDAYYRLDSGEAVFSPDLPAAKHYTPGVFHEGYAAWRLANDNDLRYLLFDANGRQSEFPEGIFPFLDVCGGVVAVCDGSGFGLARPDGTLILDPFYDWIYPAGEGKVLFGTGDLIGVMDTEGNVLLPPVLDYDPDWFLFNDIPDMRYRSGFALLGVRDGKNTHAYVFLNLEGQIICTVPTRPDEVPSYAVRSQVMENGLVWYSGTSRDDDGVVKMLYGLIRLSQDGFEYLTEPVFDRVAIPDNGIVSFSEGLFPVRQKGLWGYIDENAAWIIPPQYRKAESFRDGLAMVEKDGKLMYIDHSGAVVWEER